MKQHEGRDSRLKQSILADLNRGRWVPAKQLERVVRLIPPDETRRYAEALLERLEAAQTPERPSFWAWLFGHQRDERLNLIDSLGVLGDPVAGPALRACLTQPELRTRAIVALGRLRTPDAVDPLLHLVNNPDASPMDRHLAVEALGLIGHPSAISTLLEILEGPVADTTQRSAIVSLGKVAGTASKAGQPVEEPSIADVLTEVLEQHPDDYRYRKAVARALGYCGDPRAVVTLTACLHDRSREVRFSAARGLGRLGDPAAIPALTIASATDPSLRVREVAASALEHLHEA